MNDLGNLGEELRQRREEFGFSRNDVYAHTHIPVNCVAALEHGDARQLPPACYVAGFLRSYCALLQLEPTRYVEAYKGALEEPVQTGGMLDFRPSRKSSSQLVSWVAVCVVVLLFWLGYASVVRPSDDSGPGRVEAETVRELVVPPTPPVEP